MAYIMKHRFYLPPELWTETPVLHGQEARHLAQVLRLGTGAEVQLLDGQGRKAACRVVRVTKQQVELEVLEERHIPRPRAQAVIALAWSKAARRDFFLEKSVELGATGIWLWQAERSQGQLPADPKGSWQGQMISGSKQSGNPWLPDLRIIPGGVRGVAAAAATADQRFLPWEEQEGVPLLTPEMVGQPGVSVYVIGPEGGFADSEVQLLREAGFTPVSLGRRVLRCETAAMLCLGLHWWASGLPGRETP